MRDPFFLQTGSDGSLEDPGDCLLRFHPRGGSVATWKSKGTSIPVFWTSMFEEGELGDQGATVELSIGRARLKARRAAWKTRTSTTLFRGYDRFASWVDAQPDGRVELDVSNLADWRRPALVAAARVIIGFVEGRSTEPGPLLSGCRESVTWRMRKGAVRLEAVRRDSHWPDEVPLFVGGRWWLLLDPTMGHPPFRNAPFPEWRIVANDLTDPWPHEAVIRAREANQAWTLLEQARADLEGARRAGNLDAVARARATWETLVGAAQSLASTSAAFAAQFHVQDDTALWSRLNEEASRAQVQLAALKHEIEVAMGAAGD